MGTKSKVAVASLVMGIACFLNLLGLEKAIAAITFGWMGLKEISAEEKGGRNLAYAGIILGSLYIVTLAVILIFWGPQLMEKLRTMGGR